MYATVVTETHPTSRYHVRLDTFEGPMDLLYHMVHKEQIDIWDIPIAKLTEEYLAYLDTLQQFDIEPAAEFVVMAARLLHIKAKMLLPIVSKDDSSESEEEDPRLDLAIDLYTYALFKQAAGALEQLGTDRDRLFPRPEVYRAPFSGHHYPDPAVGTEIHDLTAAFRRVLMARKEEPRVHVPRVKVSVPDKINALRRLFYRRNRVSFDDLFRRRKSKPVIIATFLALLELIRQGFVRAIQQDKSTSIVIVRRSS